MGDYSFTELADMHYCYGFADGQSHEAAKIYAEKFPHRDHPDHTVFQKIDLQLRNGGCLAEEDIKNIKHKMADTEIKRKGRPKKRDAEVVETVTKKSVSNGDDATPPVKRGRGRPPKGTAAVAKKAPAAAAPGTGRGRGRPPKAVPKNLQKKKKESEDEEDEDDDDDEKKESSADEAEDDESS